MKQGFAALLAGALIFSFGTRPALADDRQIVFVNDSTQKASAAMMQMERGKMTVVKYGDAEAGHSLTFDVADRETVVRVRAYHCGSHDNQVIVSRNKTHVVLSAKCTVTVR